MKITKVEPIHISVPYRYGGPLAKADAIPWRTMETLLVRVETDDGLIGWGEGFGFGVCGLTRVAVERAVAPLAVGRDPSDGAALITELARKLHNYGRNGPVSFALSALDIALWDIAGKIARKPLHVMLGGKSVERVRAYASLLRYGTPDLVTRYSAEAVERGYASVKLHEVGVAEVAAARKAVGGNVALMVDCNCAWLAHEAVEMAKAFAPFDLTWLEEPCWPPEDYAALARVRAQSGVAVAAGENGGTLADMAQLVGMAKVDYLQPSVTKIGGVTELIKIAELARAGGKRIAPHSPYFGPGLIATMQVCASLPSSPPVERFYCELAASPHGEQVNVRDGYMQVPQGAGLGLDIDEAVLAKYRVG